MEAPGIFLSNYGGGAAFIIAHIIYGALVGALYAPVIHCAAKFVSPHPGAPISGVDHRQYG